MVDLAGNFRTRCCAEDFDLTVGDLEVSPLTVEVMRYMSQTGGSVDLQKTSGGLFLEKCGALDLMC